MSEEMVTDTPAIADTAQPVQGATLSKEYLDNPSITKFMQDGNVNYDNLAKSYLSLQSMLGQDKIVVPKDESDVQGWEMWDKKLGVPSKAEEYDLKLPDGTELDLSKVKELGKKLHLNQSSTQALLDAYIEDLNTQNQLSEQKRVEEMNSVVDSLKKEWGLKFNENITNANNTLKKLAGDDALYQRMNEKYGNDPDFIKLIAKAGGLLSEGSLGGFEGQVQGFNRTPAEAKKELERIMNDSNHPYWAGSRNKRDNMQWAKANGMSWVSPDEHKAAVELVQSYMAMGG